MEQNVNNVTVYRYSAFGILIDSEVWLPELSLGAIGKANVNITYGCAPDRIDAPLDADDYYQAAKNAFLLHIDGVATFYITNGDKIIVQLEQGVDPRGIRLFLLGTCMGVLLMQRGVLPMHGSTVEVNGKAVMFTGVSGAGKSTLAAALRKKGYPMLTDDISAVRLDKACLPLVQPGYPQQKLWLEGASLVGIDTIPLTRIDRDLEKFAVPVLEDFFMHPLPLAVIYELDIHPCRDVAIAQLKGAEKIAVALKHTYRAWLLNSLGLQQVHFQKCMNMATHVQIFRLMRPQNMLSVDKLVNIMEQHFTEILGQAKKRLTRLG